LGADVGQRLDDLFGNHVKIPTLVLLMTLTTSAMASAPASRLPLIDDDFAKARAETNRRKLPLFVDVWAPW
jgi:hypothetical protein